jgi:uncharacterized membrane protein
MESLLFHPKVVHLPIALALLMPALAGGILLAWWRGWLPARTWVLVVALQGILVGSGFLALQSGEKEEDRVERVVPEAAVERHEEAAEIFVGASTGVLMLMALGLVFARTATGIRLAGVAALGTVAVLATGYSVGKAGGELVYQHGAGSAYTGASTQRPRGLPGEGEGRARTDDRKEDDD